MVEPDSHPGLSDFKVHILTRPLKLLRTINTYVRNYSPVRDIAGPGHHQCTEGIQKEGELLIQLCGAALGERFLEQGDT